MGELVAESGEGLGAAGRGERVEPDEQLARTRQMSPEAVSASRISAYASCEELGDVLLQVMFHARIAAERDDSTGFTIDDIADGSWPS